MIDKVYENLIVKKENFGQWTEEIIKEGLREAYSLGYQDCEKYYIKTHYEHEDNNL